MVSAMEAREAALMAIRQGHHTPRRIIRRAADILKVPVDYDLIDHVNAALPWLRRQGIVKQKPGTGWVEIRRRRW